jgi:hypothetical protein
MLSAAGVAATTNTVMLSPFASLRVNSAKHLGNSKALRWAEKTTAEILVSF